MEQTTDRIRTILRGPQAEIERCYRCAPDNPLLHISLIVRGRNAVADLREPRFPYVKFAEDFLSVIEGDERDLFFDGAELGQGRELPCWRVFFRPGHRDGVLLATRSKRMMSHIQIWPRIEKALECRPHVMCNYTSDYNLFNRPLPIAPGTRYEMEFEIGPWRATKHEQLLDAAKLREPVQLRKPSRPRKRGVVALHGKVFAAVDLAPKRAIAQGHTPDKWMVTDEASSRHDRVLFANGGCRPPLLSVAPKLKGLHHIHVGIGTGCRAFVKLSKETFPRYRFVGGNSDFFLPFELHLGSRHKPGEVDCGVADMSGQTVTFGVPHTQQIASMLDYIRFEPLTDAQAKAHRARSARKTAIPLTGFADTYDIGYFWGDAVDPNTLPYRANLWAHAQAGFDRVFWRIDGEATDFPTKTGTLRPISCWAHNAYEPHAKAYSLMLHRHDLLRAAVDTGREHGVDVWGWMRFNSYFSGVRSEFYHRHPEFRDHSESGHLLDFRLSLVFEEVRRHKINILVEAAEYGLTGLSLGFLRHPPILCYHPVLVESYRQKHGVEPPRDLTADFFQHLTTLPESTPEHERWYRHRAEHVTRFGRELRAALAARGLRHVKVSIWVRPQHCLFDGVDIEAWLDEKLCDEVVAGPYAGDMKLLIPKPQWKQRVQSCVPLIGGINVASLAFKTSATIAKTECDRFIREGYDGICTYESNDAVVMPEMIELYQSLRLTR